MAKDKQEEKTQASLKHITPSMLKDGYLLDAGPARFRYFDPTTTQPAFYSSKPIEFESAVSRWSGKSFRYQGENWIEMREGEQILRSTKV